MRVAVRIPPALPVAELMGTIRLAEEAGFDTIAIPESFTLYRDSMMTLSLAAGVTEKATLSTSVTSFVNRDPIGLAGSMRTLNELAPGRVRLGIGAGDSAAFLTGRRPTRTAELRDGIELINGLLDGQTMDVRGTEVTLQDPGGRVPIYLAADGPRNIDLAVAIADGIITWPGELERKSAQIAEALAKRTEPRPLHHVVTTTVGVTNDLQRDAWYLKPYVLRYAQRVGPDFLEEIGFATELPADNLRLPDGVDLGHPRDLEATARFASQWISDDFAVWYAQHVCCFGTATEVASRLTELHTWGADEVQVTDGGAFHLPTRLIEDMAAEVIPALHATVANARFGGLS